MLPYNHNTVISFNKVGNLRQVTSTLYNTQDTRSVTNCYSRPLKYYKYIISYYITRTFICLVTSLSRPLPKYASNKIGLQAFTVVRFFLLGFGIIIISASHQISGKQLIARYTSYNTRTGFLIVRQAALKRVTLRLSDFAAVGLVLIYVTVAFYLVIEGFYFKEKSRTKLCGTAYISSFGIFFVLYPITLITVVVNRAAYQALNLYNYLLQAIKEGQYQYLSLPYLITL